VLRLLVAEGDRVGLGDVFGFDRSQPLAEAFAGLPQELERVGGGIWAAVGGKLECPDSQDRAG